MKDSTSASETSKPQSTSTTNTIQIKELFKSSQQLAQDDKNITGIILQTYLRRNYKSKYRGTSLQSHGSKPWKESKVSRLLGENSHESSIESFNDVDILIASRKGVYLVMN